MILKWYTTQFLAHKYSSRVNEDDKKPTNSSNVRESMMIFVLGK